MKKLLKKYKNVYFYKGFFPKTARVLSNKKFSFVHLDVDLYKSTFDALDFFYPRMNLGGIIISHDYSTCRNYESIPGVKKAIVDFFQDKPESIIELIGSQCLIVKL